MQAREEELAAREAALATKKREAEEAVAKRTAAAGRHERALAEEASRLQDMSEKQQVQSLQNPFILMVHNTHRHSTTELVAFDISARRQKKPPACRAPRSSSRRHNKQESLGAVESSAATCVGVQLARNKHACACARGHALDTLFCWQTQGSICRLHPFRGLTLVVVLHE